VTDMSTPQVSPMSRVPAPLDPTSAFREALRSHGIIPPADLTAERRIHRCDAEGKDVVRIWILDCDRVDLQGSADR